MEDRVVPKSDEERLNILQAIKTNFLFDHTTDKQKEVHTIPNMYQQYAVGYCCRTVGRVLL